MASQPALTPQEGFLNLSPPLAPTLPPLLPCSYTWACTVCDPTAQLTSVCFTGNIPAVGRQLSVSAGTFQAGLYYTIFVVATKVG